MQQPPWIDLTNIVALLLGISFTVRKLNLRRREAGHFPHVAPADFEAWYHAQTAAYDRVTWSCFGFVLADLAFKLLLTTSLPLPIVLVRVVGAGIFFGWVVFAILGVVASARAGRRAKELAIDVTRPPPAPPRERDRESDD